MMPPTDATRFFKIVLRTIPGDGVVHDGLTRVTVNGHVIYQEPTLRERKEGSQPVRVHMLAYALEKMGCVVRVHHRHGDAPPEADA